MTEKPTDLAAREKAIREYTLSLHVMGDQLSQIESWFWAHLADVREAARQELGGPLPDDVAPTAAPSAPAARAAILREAADTVDAMNEGCSRRQPCGACNAREDAADSLRRMADEAQQPKICELPHLTIAEEDACEQHRLNDEAQQPETQARLAAYQTCGVCKSGYPTGGSCGTCAFNARMAAGARQADTAGEQQ